MRILIYTCGRMFTASIYTHHFALITLLFWLEVSFCRRDDDYVIYYYIGSYRGLNIFARMIVVTARFQERKMRIIYFTDALSR